VWKGIAAIIKGTVLMIEKLCDLKCLDAACSPRAGLPQDLWRDNEARVGSLFKSESARSAEQRRAWIAARDRLTESIWAPRFVEVAAGTHQCTSSDYPGVKRVAYRVQGLLIGTQELILGRQWVAHWQASVSGDDQVGGRSSRSSPRSGKAGHKAKGSRSRWGICEGEMDDGLRPSGR
jgi:hypothetical protein